jgi:hypothetical protein
MLQGAEAHPRESADRACGRISHPDVQMLHQLELPGYGAVAAVHFWRALADSVALLPSC